jgi:small subunit ribosomal protein S3
MGQKIHPIGFRIGVIRSADSNWYADKRTYSKYLKSDKEIRDDIRKRYQLGNISRVEIERAANRIKVNIFTSRPGAIIGRGGKGIDELTNDLNRMVRKQDSTLVVQVNVTEVRQPELDAQLVAENIAVQLEKRVSHRRAMRQAMMRVTRLNGRGIKVMVSGRLNGAEIARTEMDKNGKVPLHTLRADIDYGTATATTLYGSIGIKVWLYKGEVLPEKQRAAQLLDMRKRKSAAGEDAPAAEAQEVKA